MAEARDFGYSKVPWEELNEANLKLVEAEYRQRFDGTLSDAQDLDKKAQYVLTGLIGLVTALLGLTFSQAKNVETHYLVGLFTLAAMFAFGAIFASLSVYPRTYSHAGTTPSNLDISSWLELLRGDQRAALRLSGVRIKEYARAIDEHQKANAKKSRWLKVAIAATVLGFPAAALAVVVSVETVALINSSKPAITAPVRAPVSTP